MTAASVVGAENMLTFEANPDIAADARANFERNGLSAIRSHVGVLKNRLSKGRKRTRDFFISERFTASRLAATLDDPDIVKSVKVPIFCLEDEIRKHRATVLVCDIEGGEVDLLMQADLSDIRLIIMETHYWSAGEAATDAMVRKLVLDGFDIHLRYSGRHILVLRRPQ
jgi:FkbM family methyltransferase